MRFKDLLIDHLPYPLLFLVYELMFMRRVDEEFDRAMEVVDLPLLETLDLSTVKSSDTVFILGSGASINRISPERWEVIRSHDSFGFNFWLFHEHIPSLYVCEAMDPAVQHLYDESLIDRFHEIASERADDYVGVPKIVGDLDPGRAVPVAALPERWRENLYAAPAQFALARSRDEIEWAMKRFEQRGLFEASPHLKRLFKYRATLSKLIGLALCMGYEHIVLCGIDLNTTGYYYQDQELYPHVRPLQSSPRTKVHATLADFPRQVPIDQVVYAMNELLVRPRGAKLYIEHIGSALHPALPLYE